VENKPNFCYTGLQFTAKQQIEKSGSGGRPCCFAFAKQNGRGGKSEQDRARWWLTATRSNPRESATENTQPMAPLFAFARKQGGTGNGEMVW